MISISSWELYNASIGTDNSTDYTIHMDTSSTAPNLVDLDEYYGCVYDSEDNGFIKKGEFKV